VTRKALCLGLNYPGSYAELRGAVQDAFDWAYVLEQRHYLTTVMLDHGATRDAILGGISDLLDGARWGSRMVLQFSGHGTNLRDLDGDEADGRDEAFVTADMNVIRDDEFRAITSGLPYGSRLTVIADSCFSGSVTRFVGVPDRMPGRAQARYVSPAGLTVDAPRRLRSVRSVRGGSAPMLLSGCQDDEVSYDALINGTWRGAMTAAALSVLPLAASMKDWHARTLGAVTHPQTPTLTATTYQRRLKPLT
jgi:hypothetical protein